MGLFRGGGVERPRWAMALSRPISGHYAEALVVCMHTVENEQKGKFSMSGYFLCVTWQLFLLFGQKGIFQTKLTKNSEKQSIICFIVKFQELCYEFCTNDEYVQK